MSRDGKIPEKDVENMLKIAEKVHNNPEILKALDDTVTSCVKWGYALESFFVEGSLNHIHVDTFEKKMVNFDKIKQDLQKGKAIFAHVKLPESLDHVFTVVGYRGTAHVLHAWQNEHGIRAERSMPIDEMVSLLKDLVEYDYRSVYVHKIHDTRVRLWGSDHGGLKEIDDSCGRSKIIFNAIISGEPSKPLDKFKEGLKRLSINLYEWGSAASEQSSGQSTVSSTEWHSVASEQFSGQSSITINEAHAAIRVKYPESYAAALVFVLSAGGALIWDFDWEEVCEDAFKRGLGFGVGNRVGAVVTKSTTPTIARAGVSVVRLNAATGAAMFGIFALWDVAKWAANDITAVQLRKNIAEGAAGAAGGIAGGIALGAAGGAVLGPVGAFFGGVIGGIAGGFGGAEAGKAIDKAIWNEGEDSVMNSYEFFGWHDVERGQRPLKSAKEITAAYTRMLNKKPSKRLKDKDWATYCTANLMVLLRAMYPEIKTLLKISEYLRNNGGKGVSFIGSTMYSSTYM